tara:strand:- start:469 stop:933 length:465 start_codon:yes stop_codon:yes gene_type:complete
MEKFNIVFSGELKDGWTIEQVAVGLGQLFKVDPVGLRKKIFVDSSVVLKKDLTLEQAQKYEAAMAERGASVTIASQEKIDEEPASMAHHEAIKAIDAKLAEAGALLIEPKVDEPVNFDISHLSLLEAGVNLIESVATTEPRYNLERFQIKKLDE